MAWAEPTAKVASSIAEWNATKVGTHTHLDHPRAFCFAFNRVLTFTVILFFFFFLLVFFFFLPCLELRDGPSSGDATPPVGRPSAYTLGRRDDVDDVDARRNVAERRSSSCPSRGADGDAGAMDRRRACEDAGSSVDPPPGVPSAGPPPWEFG